jgi:ADP-L-glycero-D-manno-heptose 6-epimerase
MYLVTGGAGFIGSNLVAAIEERGLGETVVVDRLRDGDKWRNIAKRDLADIVAPEDLFAWLEANGNEVTAVLHMGAISSTTERDVDLILDNNLRLSRALWQFAGETGVPFVYASSAATFGDGSAGFGGGIAGLQQYRPLNPYGWSKHLFDRMVAADLRTGRPTPPQWAGLKFFNVYGPNEYHKGDMQSVVAKLYPKVQGGAPATLFRSYRPDFADGGQSRDFVYIDDVVDMMLWLLEHPEVSGLFNAGSGQARSFQDLATATMRAAGVEPRIEYIDMPEAIRDRYQYFTEADMSGLRAVGYDRAPTGLDQGIERYVRAFLATPDPYR